MDPITTAILAALSAGVAQSAGKTGEHLIVDAYQALKTAIKGKLGVDSEVTRAVDALERKPTSQGRQATLAEEVAIVKANEDPELLGAAQAILDHVGATPAGRQIITTIGGYNAVALDHSQAWVNIHSSSLSGSEQ
jgi:hypothetical protein